MERLIFVSAAELSAELYASLVFEKLGVKGFGVGGENLKRAGAEIILPMERLQIGGIFEIIPRLREIKRMLDFLEEEIVRRKPVLLFLVDFPDFHFRLAARVKKKVNIPVIHFISPTVWAWREGRMKKIKRLIDLELLIFPFEQEIYSKWGLPHKFVSHPLFEIVKLELSEEEFRKKYWIHSDYIAVLPGSRPQELHYHMETLGKFAEVIRKRHGLEVLLPVAPSVREEIKKYDLSPFVPIFEERYSAMAYSKVVVCASGTVPLEAAILEKPHVVFYRLSSLTYLFRPLVKLSHYSIVNILAGHEVVRELIQKDFTVENLLRETESLLNDSEKREKMLREFRRIKSLFPPEPASRIAAEAIQEFMKKH